MNKATQSPPLREVTREEIWAMLRPEDQSNIRSLLETFQTPEERKTLPIEIRVGDCVYRRPDLRRNKPTYNWPALPPKFKPRQKPKEASHDAQATA